MQANGIASCKFDINLSQPIEGKQDAMNILTDPGFAFFGSSTPKKAVVWDHLHMSFGALHDQNTFGMWGPVRLILLAILNARFDDFVFLAGLVCSSYVTVSMGTHYRDNFCGRRKPDDMQERGFKNHMFKHGKSARLGQVDTPMPIFLDITIKHFSNQDFLFETLGLGNQSFLPTSTTWINWGLSQIKPWSCPNTGFPVPDLIHSHCIVHKQLMH